MEQMTDMDFFREEFTKFGWTRLLYDLGIIEGDITERGEMNAKAKEKNIGEVNFTTPERFEAITDDEPLDTTTEVNKAPQYDLASFMRGYLKTAIKEYIEDEDYKEEIEEAQGKKVNEFTPLDVQALSEKVFTSLDSTLAQLIEHELRRVLMKESIEEKPERVLHSTEELDKFIKDYEKQIVEYFIHRDLIGIAGYMQAVTAIRCTNNIVYADDADESECLDYIIDNISWA